jgi:N-acetylmuramoyl-L-alanine amidase
MKIVYCLFLLFHCNPIKQIRLSEYKLNLIVEDYSTLSLTPKILEKLKGRERYSEIKSIIMHSTNTMSKEEYLTRSAENGFGVHLMISKNAKYYGIQNLQLRILRATPKLDESAIHIAMEGSEEEILSNPAQLNAAGKILKKLSDDFAIPFSNEDINSEKGIFTHIQAKKKFGNFVDLNEFGIEKILKVLLRNVERKYFPEDEWAGRFEKNWTLRREKKNSIKVETEFDRGRGITKQSSLELPDLERDESGQTPEEFRLKYVFKQKIKPTCVVLHFTAISSFKISQDTLERRKLSATIMVDKDSKAYQLLDHLDDLAQAASGTNQDCIQIEIVGKNTEELMANENQIDKVRLLVLSLANKYKIPLNNYQIESLKGIYSHTQAKKKFGGSVALYGKDFDPGEPYMKKILEACNGKFFEEKDWFERKSDNWIIYDYDFMP